MPNRHIAYMIGIIILGAVILAAIATAATAQPSAGRQCGSMDVIERILLVDYNEEPLGVGTTGKDEWTQGMRLYVNSKTRSWTIISISPSGLVCIQMAGENFEIVKPELLGQPS